MRLEVFKNGGRDNGPDGDYSAEIEADANPPGDVYGAFPHERVLSM